jgi:cell division protein ZapE
MFVHYQAFMQDIHKSIHKNRITDMEKVVPMIAKKYSSSIRLLCIDEFEIKDIADAMIIGRLLTEFAKNNVFIVITSNTKPENLYKDGIQRESFLPSIALINKNYKIFELSSGIDYRLNRVSSKKRMFCALNDETSKELLKIIDEITNGESLEPIALKVFGREVIFARSYKSLLVTDFNELCVRDISYNDYIEICRVFSIIILQNVPILSHEGKNEVIRFINFIDNAYFNKVKLFISLATEPEALYSNGEKVREFDRAISRLHEMSSDSY